MSIRVMIVDDHEVVRIGLKALFDAQEGFEVVAEAKNAQEAIEKADIYRPKIILMDIRLPDLSGVEACRRILEKRPEIKVLMLTSYSDKEAVIGSIMAGASGYVLKKVWSNELIEKVKIVSEGRSLLDISAAEQVMDYIKGLQMEETEELQQLTPQEKKVLTLIARAKTNKQIAEDLFLSEKTVRNYVSNILRKLELDNRSEAVLYGQKTEWFI